MRSILKSLFFLLALIASQARAADDFPREIADFLIKQGPVTTSQAFSSDNPLEQIALYYCVDENLHGGANAGASNPANVHCDVALFNKRGATWEFANKISVGQGTIFDFVDGLVLGEVVSYNPEDALCCPSNSTEIELNTSSGKLIPSQQNHKP